MGNNGDEPFLQAATRLGDFQLVIAHQAIYSSVGVKLIDSGVRVDSGLYDRLLNHKLRVPIENCLTAENSVTVDELRDHAERLVAERAFYGQLVADLGDRAILLAAIARIRQPDLGAMTFARSSF
ncbi:hypothetical protein [Candidatus Accumulibacter sp. ACC003]|uniref:hypothetical protein n=1 Tax=Candidatus Accumulibacter sp. ACC003 TaxID=2823334 RepID=UPI0025BD6FCE|nr:hypothetical protein [Candidatus Accumulibacter sp. ACC003]